MTEFDDYFEDAFDDLLITMGEPVVYVPHCGPARTMDAIVDRSPGERWVNGEVITPLLVIRVHNDSECGIDHNELDTPDQVLVSLRPRAQHSRRTISKVDNSDGGVTELAVM